jgi:hypothetical protein
LNLGVPANPVTPKVFGAPREGAVVVVAAAAAAALMATGFLSTPACALDVEGRSTV